ncbi:hypothetical protein GQ54DRAFT_255696 [Martensiomyces pterosporus]|nr:hypothetical protein GQ54DRAFT_255696 [Martensiomyces pterosporus]
MVRLPLQALSEFVARLSKFDYEPAKIANSKVMEAHIQLGALMFSLLTIEMMYTSMDYLAPGNFRRGNGYILNMYGPLPKRLRKTLKKLTLDYEEEHRRLLYPLTTTPASEPAGTQAAAYGHDAAHGRRGSSFPPPGLGEEFNGHNDTASQHAVHAYFLGEQGRHAHQQHQNAASVSPSNVGAGDRISNAEARGFVGRNSIAGEASMQNMDLSPYLPVAAHSSGPFDAEKYLTKHEEAERLLEELGTVQSFVHFVIAFVEVRRTMVVLYRLIAVTGPILEVEPLTLLLDRCDSALRTVNSNPLYDSLLSHVQREVRLVRGLVEWEANIREYNFVKSVTSMQRMKALLNAWKADLPPLPPSSGAPASSGAKAKRSIGSRSIYESISDAIGGQHEKENVGAGNSSQSRGLFFTAFAKSTRMVQSFLWGSSGTNSGTSNQDPASSRMRNVIVWIGYWTDSLSLRTTAYFQQIIAPYRSLYHDDMTVHAKQVAVMDEIWSRPGLSKTNLNEAMHGFMQSNDAYFVVLLFESSKSRPFVPDGFAISGTRIKVSDFHVQACAVLFCMTNQRLMHMRGIALKDSLVQDVHSVKLDPGNPFAVSAERQFDTDWFRQNCLPDVLSILESDRELLDHELLTSNPMVKSLGPDTEKLLKELDDSVHSTIDDFVSARDSSQGSPNASKQHQQQETALGCDDAMHGTAENGTKRDVANRISDTPISEQSLAGVLPAEGSLSTNAPNNLPHSDISVQGETARNSCMDVPVVQVESGDKSPVSPSDGDIYDPDMEEQLYHESMSSLYSSYMLKSHLRNNSGSTGQNIHGNRSFVGRRSSRGVLRVDSMRVQQSALSLASGQIAWDQRGTLGGEAGIRGDAVDLHGDARAANDSVQHSASASNLPTKYATTGRNTGKEAASKTEETAGMRGLNGPQAGRRQSTDMLVTADSSINPTRQAPSVQSLFRNPSKPSATGQQLETPDPRLSDSDMVRRIRSGERLRELSGSRNLLGESGAHTSPHGKHSRRGSIHSLSFSTPTRASLGSKTGGAVAAAAAAAATTVSAAEASGGFTRRLTRAAVSPKSATMLEAGAAAPVTTIGYACDPGSGNRPELSPLNQHQMRGGHGKHAKLHQAPPPVSPQQTLTAAATAAMSAPPASASASASASAVATAANRLEGYTYFYSRINTPNITLVSVLLDTDKSLSRRNEAERTWVEIVDAIRGTPLFEQLMTLPA